MGFNSACQSYCSTPVCGYNSDSICYSVSSKDTNMYSIFYYLLKSYIPTVIFNYTLLLTLISF